MAYLSTRVLRTVSVRDLADERRGAPPETRDACAPLEEMMGDAALNHPTLAASRSSATRQDRNGSLCRARHRRDEHVAVHRQQDHLVAS
jgi:hypothetical protein